MDVVSTIISAVVKGMEAIAWAQGKGYLGGKSDWMEAATSAMGLLDRGKDLIAALLADPTEYDRLEAMPQAEKEAEIKRLLYPTPLADLVEKTRKDMTGG